MAHMPNDRMAIAVSQGFTVEIEIPGTAASAWEPTYLLLKPVIYDGLWYVVFNPVTNRYRWLGKTARYTRV